MSERNTYARAQAGYDPEHERELLAAITRAIAETSRLSDAAVMCIRTGELASALLSALAFTLALSPSVVRSPTAMRKTIDELGKRLRRRVAAAEADETVQAFATRIFRGPDVGGNA